MFLEQVMESITDAYCAIDADWRYVFMNRAGYALLNRDPADTLVGKVIWDELEIAPEFEEAYRRARDEQVASRGHRLPRTVGPLDLQPGPADGGWAVHLRPGRDRGAPVRPGW